MISQTRAVDEYKTLQEIVLTTLRREILSGAFKDGEKLNQDQLASRLGVSRMPVREALRRLEAEGLVKFTAHRGAMVTTLSTEEVAQVFDIRCNLEGMATRLAAQRASFEDLKRLREIFAEMEKAKDNHQAYVKLNREFHEAVYKASGYPLLTKIISGLWDNIERYIMTYIALPGRMELAQQQHRELITFCEKKDAIQAESLLQRHIEGSVGDIKNYVLSALTGSDNAADQSQK